MLVGIPAGGVISQEPVGGIGPDPVTLVLRVNVDPASDPVPAIWSFLAGICDLCDGQVAHGTVPGPDADVTSIFFTLDSVRFFGPSAGEFEPGTTSDPFFLSFVAGVAGVGDSMDLTTTTELTTFDAIGTFTIVPEPASAGLLGLGLAGLGLRLSGRRARGRSCGRRAQRCGSPRPRPA